MFRQYVFLKLEIHEFQVCWVFVAETNKVARKQQPFSYKIYRSVTYDMNPMIFKYNYWMFLIETGLHLAVK